MTGSASEVPVVSITSQKDIPVHMSLLLSLRFTTPEKAQEWAQRQTIPTIYWDEKHQTAYGYPRVLPRLTR